MVKRGHLAIPDVSEARDRRIIAAKALDAEGDLGGIDEYEKALALVPDDIEVLRRCGEIWEAKGQWRLAREEYAEDDQDSSEDRMAANKIRSLEVNEKLTLPRTCSWVFCSITRKIGPERGPGAVGYFQL